MGFRLNQKWVFSVHPRLSTNSSSKPSSYSFKGKDSNYDMARVSLPSAVPMEIDTLYSDRLSANACSSVSQTLENDYSEPEEIKRSVGKTLRAGLCTMIDDNIQMTTGDDKLRFLTSLQASKASKYNLLLENLVILEETFSDSNVVRLERDILVQLERLGALKLFHTFLSRTLKIPSSHDFYDVSSEFIEDPRMDGFVNDHVAKIVVRSRRKEERKSRRERAAEKADKICTVEFSSKTNRKVSQHINSSARRSSSSRGRRPKITRNEAELSKGVKLVANLERLKMMLEEETELVISLSNWAAAAGVDKKVLRENLYYGWCCRDELLRSTRSLVVYLARKYSGQGVAFEDLIQAGNFGVLQGAERFDQTRGYKFSTYVQYWIRKSMSMLMSRHARGIRIPFTLSKAVKQIQKARRALHNSHGKYPDDDKIAKFTGLSLAKIASASKCPRVVGSLDQKIGDCINAKYLELTPDTTMKSPEETVLRQQMLKEMYGLLNGLDPRERKVLVLRFGLGGDQRKSLEEIGKLFSVSKEWIRKIERTALTKLKDEETLQSLKHYLHV